MCSLGPSDLKKHFYDQPKSVTAEVGDRVRLNCLPPDGRPRPVVFWMKNDVIILESHPISNNDKKEIELGETGPMAKTKKTKAAKRKPSGGEDKTRVTRAAEQDNPGDEKKKKKKDEGDDYDEDYDDEEVEEDEEEVEDKAQGKDKAKQHSDHDYKDEELLPDHLDDLPMTHENYIFNNDFSLTIKKVDLADQANYTCGVRNWAGTRYSRPGRVTVKGNNID